MIATDALAAGLASQGLVLPPICVDQLRGYERLLGRWNRIYNLVSAHTESKVVNVHILDSLSVLPYLKGRQILDVGTGAGLPGMMLAIAAPQISFTLLDSAIKRTRFCQHVVLELGLQNVSVLRSRVEDFVPNARFSTVVSRAFSSIVRFLPLTEHLVAENGRIIVMKANLDSELDGLEAIGDNTVVVPVSVPGLNAKRHLVMVDASSVRTN